MVDKGAMWHVDNQKEIWSGKVIKVHLFLAKDHNLIVATLITWLEQGTAAANSFFDLLVPKQAPNQLPTSTLHLSVRHNPMGAPQLQPALSMSSLANTIFYIQVWNRTIPGSSNPGYI